MSYALVCFIFFDVIYQLHHGYKLAGIFEFAFLTVYKVLFYFTDGNKVYMYHAVRIW